jgi:4-hydroxybenzoate polyprenyltransferase
MNTVKQKLLPFIQLMRLDRPVGIYLVLWPALWALWLAADGTPPLHILAVFVLGAVLMRSAGCVINDYADRNFDGHVARTCQRPLATGAVTPKQALKLFAVLCLVSFGLVLLLNPLTVLMSFVALGLAALYPFTKRLTHWPQAFLGAAFAWAVPMAFTAVQNQLPWQVWPLFAATLIWALIYDTAYALVDREDDLKIGIKSTAIGFGRYVNEMIGLFQLLMLALLIWVGQIFSLHWPYYLSLVGMALGFGYHQWLLRKEQPALAFKVFLQNHWLGFLLWLGIVVDKAFY